MMRIKAGLLTVLSILAITVTIGIHSAQAVSVVDSGTSDPASPVTGQEFYRTDSHADQIYDGQWIRQDMEIRNVKAFGAKGDGSTDDRAAIQAAIDSLNVAGVKGGIIFFPTGRYVIGDSLIIPTSIYGVIFQGSGASESDGDGTLLTLDSSNSLFTQSGITTLKFMQFKDMRLTDKTTSGGHLIDISVNAADIEISNVTFFTRNPASSFLRIIGGNPSHIYVSHVRGLQGAYHSVPMIDIASEPGCNIFGIVLENMMLNANATDTAPMISLDNLSGGNMAACVTFRNLTLEAPGGGGIRVKSITNLLFENIHAADLKPYVPVNPIIDIQRGTVDGSPYVRDAVMLNCAITEGTSSYPDVRFTSASSNGGLVLIGCRTGYLDAQGNPPIAIGCADMPNLVGSTLPLWLDTGGRLRGVRGISATNTACRNMRGSVTITSTNASGAVAFPLAEADTNYYVTASVAGVTGTPATGATRAYVTGKSTTGFTVNLETAPGAGNSVRVEWHVIR
ncbi:MAG: glycosyl hydrolase family 28-related protein [bacterium]|nr:glycosyl hydrolase family 28-related protein [bacterium]